jgi:hypothetical protein
MVLGKYRAAGAGSARTTARLAYKSPARTGAPSLLLTLPGLYLLRHPLKTSQPFVKPASRRLHAPDYARLAAFVP